MAVVKLSSSKRAVQVILSEDLPAGTVLQVSSKIYEMLLRGEVNGGFVVLSRLATPTLPDKFPVSPVWGDDLSVAGVKDSLGVRAKRVVKERGVKESGEVFSPWK